MEEASALEENSVGSELIDATQNAVIEAVTNVSEMLEKTTTEETSVANQPHEIFYQSAEFWVGMAFVLVVVVIAVPLLRTIKKMLLNRRDKIVGEISEAQDLQNSAQDLLAKYERQALSADKEAAMILDNANEVLQKEEDLKTTALSREILKREQETERSISASIYKAQSEINSIISKKTVDIVQKYLSEKLSSKQKSKLIDDSIKNILKKLS